MSQGNLSIPGIFLMWFLYFLFFTISYFIVIMIPGINFIGGPIIFIAATIANLYFIFVIFFRLIANIRMNSYSPMAVPIVRVGSSKGSGQKGLAMNNALGGGMGGMGGIGGMGGMGGRGMAMPPTMF